MIPTTASLAEFADIARIKRSYVTQLKADGRLVLTEDRKRVCVAESLARIQATRDPSKAGVVARHAAARAAVVDEAPADDVQTSEIDPSGSGYQHWRERSERAKALAAERDNLVADGKLMDASDVTTAIADAVTTLRTRLSGLGSILAPQVVVAGDEAKARGLIDDAVEHALDETARQFHVIARQVVA